MWNLYLNESGEAKYLRPLVFSNSKTQEDVVKEVIKSIENDCKVIFIKGVCGTGKCLDKNSLIFCKPDNKNYFGYYKISDLVGKIGRIFSINNKGNIVESNFKNVRKTGNKELYKLETRTGRELIASKNHLFLTITEKGIEWLPLEKLTNSSYICLPNKINIRDNLNFDDNKIKVLAHLIAEGKLGDKVGSPSYYRSAEHNPKVREDYEDSLKKLFPEGELKSYFGKDVNIIFRSMDTRFGTTNKLRLFMRKCGLDGKKSNEKFVPKIIFNLKKEKIALFLSRLFSCDGSIYFKKNKNRKENQIIIEYSSTSDRLIRDISILLCRFGIQHTITSKKFKENSYYSRRILISNHKSIRDFIENIGFIGKKQKLALNLYKKTKIHKFTNIDKVPRIVREYLKNKGHNYNQLDRFLNYEEIEKLRENKGYKRIKKDKHIKTPCVFKQGKIDFLREHLIKANEYIKDEVISFICSGQIFWDKVKSKEFIKEDETYDLEAPKFHNFIANGIVTHNSAIALNLAKELGKASVVVPVKALQKQYEDDYTNKKFLLKDENKSQKLKIKIITGRANHICPYLQENVQEYELREKNAELKDFNNSFTNNEVKEKPKKINNDIKNISCDNYQLPCKIEVKEKNIKKIMEYLRKNPKIELMDFINVPLSRIRRMSIAPVCPYWSPIVPSEVDLGLDDAVCKNYQGLKGINYTIYQRKLGCGYYNQFNAYVDSDVIIFNSQKYKLETLMNRKPSTAIEIIDECDKFLDNFSNTEKVNLNRFNIALGNLFAGDNKTAEVINELITLTKNILNDKEIENSIQKEEIIHIKDTKILSLLKYFLDSDFMNFVECDEENYCYHVDEVARIFDGFFNETYISFHKEDKDLFVRLVTTNLEKRFKQLLDKNKIIVMMSGTIHSRSVLENIFGLSDYKIVEAETKIPGEITPRRIGYEINCKYSNFKEGKVTRKQYLLALCKCIEQAKKPVLVHVNAFKDLPTEQEIKLYNLHNIITQEKLKQLQIKDRTGEAVKKFKEGKINILYSTKCNRGVDFPGSICNSIILTKYPYPNAKDLFWKILKRTKPQHYKPFYMDKAKREFLQRIYRGLRSENDHVFLLSPDVRVFERIAKILR